MALLNREKSALSGMGTLDTHGLQRRAEATDLIIEGLAKQINFTGVAKAAADTAGSLDGFHIALLRATSAVEGFSVSLGVRGAGGTAPTAPNATPVPNADHPGAYANDWEGPAMPAARGAPRFETGWSGNNMTPFENP
jgi:hypothetical protein